MKKLLILPIICLCSYYGHSQTYSTVTLTHYMDQLRFEPSGYDRHWIMSKPGDNKAFALYSPDDGAGWFTYWKTGSGDMIISRGKLGIGLSSPGGKLDVFGGNGGYSNPTLNLTSNSSTNAWALITLKGGLYDGTSDYMIGRGRSNYNNGRSLTLHIPSRVGFYSGTGVMPQISFVSSGAVTLGYVEAETGNWYMKGNVGIGTTTPSEKLEVNGTIRSKEVKVEATPWPDYVFAPEYELQSLEETETYIKENHRLPDMPSAEEVAEHGIELGEMNRLVVEKLEEVTLHLIELEKENHNLKKENERIKSELSQRPTAKANSQLNEKLEELTLHIIELKKEVELLKAKQ